MSSTLNIRNYKSLFQYPTLDKIHGQPTLDTILHLVRQLKINAQSIPTTIGGGQLGYLGLVISQQAYNSIPNAIPFQRPQHPGPFMVTIPRQQLTSESSATRPTRSTTTTTTTQTTTATPTITTAVVTQQKAEYDEKLRLYNECQSVENALRQQLQEALEIEYLDALRDPHTHMIQETIPDIIEYLQKTYGFLTDEALSEKEDVLKQYIYDPTKSVDDVFNKIIKHQDLCVLMNNPLTDRQLVGIAYKIFNRTQLFQNALIKWNKKPSPDKTFTMLKIHMRQQWNELNKVGALKIQDSTLNQANLIQEINEQQQDLIASLKNDINNQFRSTIADAIMMLQQQNHNDIGPDITNTSSSDSANSVTSNITLDTLLSTIKDLKAELTTIKSSQQTCPPVVSNNDEINPRRGKPWKRYCWTHGCCTHHGRNCPNRTKGHKDEANFKNRLGGSNKGCLGSG